jgi:hypothetical protein
MDPAAPVFTPKDSKPPAWGLRENPRDLDDLAKSLDDIMDAEKDLKPEAEEDDVKDDVKPKPEPEDDGLDPDGVPKYDRALFARLVEKEVMKRMEQERNVEMEEKEKKSMELFANVMSSAVSSAVTAAVSGLKGPKKSATSVPTPTIVKNGLRISVPPPALPLK